MGRCLVFGLSVCLHVGSQKRDFVLHLFFEVFNGHILSRILAYTSCVHQVKWQAASGPTRQSHLD
jgi:hypothetical protein